MDNRPIGMFDSGVGGMTVFKELKEKLPNEDIIYIGDSASFPYGSKSKETIITLTKKRIEELIQKNVKLIVIACGTATSQALEEVKDLYTVPIIGIIKPTVEYLKEKTYQNIGVMATTGTIRSGGWKKQICKEIPNCHVQNKACPLLAPMAEEGWTDNEIARLTVHQYVKDFKNVDALVLGCTHYPLFKKIMVEELGNQVEIINTGEMVANDIENYLVNHEMQKEEGKADYQIYLTDTECNFIEVAKKLLNDDELVNKIQKI